MSDQGQGIGIDELLQHGGWLRRLARALAPDEASAEDILQETWMAAVRHPPAGGRPVRPWLAEVARNFAWMGRRSQARRRLRETVAGEPLTDSPTPEALVVRMQLQRLVAGFILELAEPYRSTLLLRFYEDRSDSEIARIQGVQAGTVRWRINEGIGRLRTRLDEHHAGSRRNWRALLVPVGLPNSAWVSFGGWILKSNSLSKVAGIIVLALVVGLGWSLRKGHQNGSRPAGGEARVDPSARAIQSGLPSFTSPAAGGTIECRVQRGDGVPVQAVLALSRALGAGGANDGLPSLAGVAESGKDGSCRFIDLPAGRYTLSAMARESGFLPGIAENVEIAPGSTRSITLKLESGGFAVTGRVLDRGGGVVAGARVAVRSDAGSGTGAPRPLRHLASLSDHDGKFTLTLEAGAYSLLAEADGYARAGEYLYVDAPLTRDLILDPTTGVFGRVVWAESGAGVAGAEVRAIPTWHLGRRYPKVATDLEGRFRLEDLGVGEVFIEARRGRWMGRTEPLVLVPTKPHLGVDVAVVRGLAISGTARWDTGSPAEGVNISLTAENGESLGGSGQSGGDGSFRLEGIPPGSYGLAGWTNEGARAYRAIQVRDRDLDRAELVVSRPVQVEGRVVGVSGAAVAQARVYARSVQSSELGGTTQGRVATTDVDGRFSVEHNLPPGAVMVLADIGERGVATWGPEEVDAGSSIFVDLVLTAGATLSGTVRGPDGSPAEARVFVRDHEAMAWRGLETTSDRDGRYRLGGLVPGRIRVAAGPLVGGNGGAKRDFTISPEGPNVLDLELPAVVVLRGKVVLPGGDPAAGAMVLVDASKTKPRPEGARRGIVGNDGRFEIPDLQAGAAYYVWADLPGYGTSHLGPVRPDREEPLLNLVGKGDQNLEK